MYVIKNGKLVEDTVIDQFKFGWELYELCEKDDIIFRQMAILKGLEPEKAVEFLELLKEARELI